MYWSMLLILALLTFCGICEGGWQFEAHNLNDICELEGIGCVDSSEIKQKSDGGDCFRAAVYEQNHRLDDKRDSRLTAERNLEVYERVANIAASNGADILVFPEDGLFLDARDYMIPATEPIPDPKMLNETNNNPCEQPEQFKLSKILQRLSCMARENRLYLVVNYGAKESCENYLATNQECRSDGILLYNTDVVLDPKGKFVARYRKYNLYTDNFDRPQLESVHFDTPHGRFGLMTCLDMLYKSPAVDLVEEHQIDTAILLTYWFDQLPFGTAIQYHDGWSLANKVNFLVSNNHERIMGTVGSGIYTRDHILYTNPETVHSKLLLANVPKKFASNTTTSCLQEPKSIVIDTERKETSYNYTNFPLKSTDAFQILVLNQTTRTACSGAICCTVDYKIHSNNEPKKTLENSLNRLVLVVRDGFGRFNNSVQLCFLTTLVRPLDLARLNETSYSLEASVVFESLNLEATFTTRHVLPIASHSIRRLVEHQDRSFSCEGSGAISRYGQQRCKLATNFRGQSKPICTLALFGRAFELDGIYHPIPGSSLA